MVGLEARPLAGDPIQRPRMPEELLPVGPTVGAPGRRPDATARCAEGGQGTSAARVAVTWTNTAGDLSSGSKNFTGGAASGPATHVGLWGALTGGTFYGWYPISGDQTFNAAGEFTITQVTLDSTVS